MHGHAGRAGVSASEARARSTSGAFYLIGKAVREQFRKVAGCANSCSALTIHYTPAKLLIPGFTYKRSPKCSLYFLFTFLHEHSVYFVSWSVTLLESFNVTSDFMKFRCSVKPFTNLSYFFLNSNSLLGKGDFPNLFW